MKLTNKLSYLLLVAVLLSACNSESEKKVSRKTEIKKSLQTMTLEPKTMSEDIQLPGVMEPFEWVQIFPKISGFVKDVYVDRGSIVHKGSLLLKLEAPEIEERLAAAKLKYVEAQAMYYASKDKYFRLKETSKTPGTVSPYDLSASMAKMMADSATVQGELANYKAQQALADYLEVRAPFDGVITERNVHPGALVGPGAQNAKPMLVLQEQAKLRMVINVPEEYSMQLSKNGKVQFHVNALLGQTFTGTLARSAGSLNEHYRSEAVEVDIPNGDHKFIPGMYAEVVLPASGDHNAFVVPESAVVTTTERKYIVAVRDNQTKLIDVTVGHQQNDSTEVFGELKQGDKVVVNASYEIKDGKSI